MRTTTMRGAMTAALLCAAAPAYAKDLAVPKQYRTIDDALAAAQSGDRIVVRGGRHADVVLDKDGVSLVGRGATLSGGVTVSGAGDVLRGFRIAARSRVTVTADDVTIADNRFDRMSTALFVEGADRVTVEGNSLSAAGLRVEGGDFAVMRANRLPAVVGESVIQGNHALMEDNIGGFFQILGSDGVFRSNRTFQIHAEGADVVIEGNSAQRGIEAYGDRAQVRGNRASSLGVTVFGDDAVVEGNVVRRSNAGVGIEGDRSLVQDNDIEVGFDVAHSPCFSSIVGGILGIYVQGDGGTVAGNVVVHRTGRGIVLVAAGAQVQGNTLQGQSSATSVSVEGKGNTLTDNHVAQSGSQANQGNGFQVTGDANVLRGNDVSGTASDGVVIAGGAGNVVENLTLAGAGGCGILVDAGATGTSVSAVTVSGGDVAFVNAGTQTSLTGSTLQNGRFADVVDVSGFRAFDGNTFATLSHDTILVPVNPNAVEVAGATSAH